MREHHKKFPAGKVPACAYTTTNVTTANDAEKLVISVTCNGLEKGTPICIQGMATIALGASCDAVNVDIVEGGDVSGTDVGEASETLATASKGIVVHQTVSDTAFQSNPTYSMTVVCVNAAANCTIQSSSLLVTPVGA